MLDEQTAGCNHPLLAVGTEWLRKSDKAHTVVMTQHGRWLMCMGSQKWGHPYVIGIERFLKTHDPMLQTEVASTIQRKVRGALHSCIDTHGPITKGLVESAAKRITGLIVSSNKDTANNHASTN